MAARADVTNAARMERQRTIVETLGQKSSPLEKRFAWGWKACHGPELESEFKFHPTRKWSFDFAHPATLVAFEIEGGIYMRMGGRHTRGKGFANDCEKYNEAALLGWAVFRLTEEQLRLPFLGRMIGFLYRRLPPSTSPNP